MRVLVGVPRPFEEVFRAKRVPEDFPVWEALVGDWTGLLKLGTPAPSFSNNSSPFGPHL